MTILIFSFLDPVGGMVLVAWFKFALECQFQISREKSMADTSLRDIEIKEICKSHRRLYEGMWKQNHPYYLRPLKLSKYASAEHIPKLRHIFFASSNLI